MITCTDISEKEAYLMLQTISNTYSSYTKISGLRKHCILAFVDDMKHIISAKLHRLAPPKTIPLVHKPELSLFAKKLTAMLFNLSTKEAKHQLYTILRFTKKYSRLSGMHEDSLTAFARGLLQDFC